MNEKYCSIIQIYILSISLHIQNLIKIHKFIEHKQNSDIDHLLKLTIRSWILCISMHIQNFIKRHPFVLTILRKNTSLHESRAITLVIMNGFSLFPIPNHSSLISMSMQSLKEIGHKLLVGVRKRSADGRTYTQTVRRV